MEPVPGPSSSSASGTGGGFTPSTSRYELQNSVSEIFRLLKVNEGKHFSRATISERFEKNLNRQSSKPFSLFYNRLADNPEFVKKYQELKCKNVNEVDPFVRLLVRVREDKNLNNFFNNYSTRHMNRGMKTPMSKQVESGVSTLSSQQHHVHQHRHHKSTSKPRASSASAALLSGLKQATATPLKPLNQQTGLLLDPLNQSNEDELHDNFRSPPGHTSAIKEVNNLSLVSNSSSQHQQNRKLPAYVSRDFYPLDWPQENDCYNTLGTHPIAEQEQMLLRDLLYVLIGIEGRFIRLVKSDGQDSKYKLLLDPSTDHFLKVTTNRILKISYCYSAIITFIESRVYGLVNQALVSSIQQHVYDYNMLVSEMEDMLLRNDLFLQKMFYILLPFFSTFSLLKDLCAKLYRNKSVGGAVLTILHEKTKSIQGMDNHALDLCLNITKSACIPYFDILKTWIYYGEIDDPRREFFIEDTHGQPSVQGPGDQHPQEQIESDDEYDDDFGKFNDKYWDLRYRLNCSKTPIFLKRHEQTIFKTGKYVSIINKVKQLFLKSSKVIPLPASLLVNPPATATSCTTTTTSSNEIFKVPSSSSLLFWNNQNQLDRNVAVSGENLFVSTVSSSSTSSGSHSQSATPAPTTAAALFTPKPEEIQYSFDESTYICPIIAAYEEASSQLLHILIHESQLVETFNAVKHYMLLSTGDFILHFMKFAAKDLCKRTDSVVQHRLDSMMGMALGISVCHSDRQFLKDDPHVEFAGKSLLKELYRLNRPLDGERSTFDPSPSSSCLIRCDDDEEEDEGDEDIALNRSIISSVIETGISNQVELGDQVDSKHKYVNSGRPRKSIDQSDGNAVGRMAKDSVVPTEAIRNKLFCYESLMFKFDVPFPLSLIFTQKSIVCYELLFRYMFLCRYAEFELEETWKDNILDVQLKKLDALQLVNSDSTSEPAHDPDTARLLTRAFKSIHKKAFALRYKMIAFVRNFHYFYAFEVIDPFFAQFILQISKRGSSLDSVIECHEKFLEHCFSSCFLNNLEITSIIIKIFTLCIELSHALKDSIDVDDQSSIMESSVFFNPANGQLEVKTGGSSVMDGKPRDSKSPFEPHIHEKLNSMYFSNQHHGKSVRTIKEIVEKANCDFDQLVSQLLKKIFSDNCEYHTMYPFVARLDYNDFYRSKIIE